MATNISPKGILKKSPAVDIPLPATLPVPKTDAEQRRLDTAIQHAQLLEDQKQIQARNLDAIEELSDFPASATYTSAEAERFTSLVTQFQPSDYDALIEERHANSRCGYTLCSNSPRKDQAKLSWLRSKGAENWCSDGCAKRALYVKAQLDEIPAWERRGGSTPQIVLYSHDTKAAPVKAPKQQSGDDELAVERGEKSSSTKVDRVVSKDILEKSVSTVATVPAAVRFAEDAHKNIEGYQPRSGIKHEPVISTNGL